jgi:hypothetical protein
MTKEEIKEYKRQYARGWNCSARGTEGALERMDWREPNNSAWYDGYHDDAAGRDRFINEQGVHRITGEAK